MTTRFKAVVLDTNILISALLFTGHASKIIPLLKNKQIELIISKEILQEYIRVLSYPKFSLIEEEIKLIINEYILPFAKVAKPYKLDKSYCSDPDDEKFLACAKSAEADAIVSGDNDLLDLKHFKNIPIMSLADFLKEF